ncbi:MAG: hypothetical protein B1H09_02960 [Gemmatimonadaceae bacterium 4484_173]|nr:MAG: hypothetical protein B1H09_02960 [Gemmatimonadaceae bacterium 4484_173]RKZ03947.1 MAG: MFS transporter [Candidatus Fermentibacteria bacterium]
MNTTLTQKNSKHNFRALLWHGIFLSLASNFMDVDTVIPSMILNAGGNAVMLGIMTTIMIGGSSLMQIVFASFLSNRASKKSMLLAAINLRVVSLIFLGLILFTSSTGGSTALLFSIFVLISVFSFSGSFANISYVDIMGKSILEKDRKGFFSVKQTIGSLGILVSAIAVRQLLKHLSYPQNYGTLLSAAGILLFVASLGFWKIREIDTRIEKKRTFREFLALIPKNISRDSNLKNYLLIINFMGLAVSFIPFMILYAKNNFDFSFNLIGNILLFKVVGMLSASLVLYKRSHKFHYKNLLYFSLVCGVSLPVLSLVFRNNQLAYQFLFLVSGVFVTAFRIARSGILVEISNNENRATYTGISGAGSILPAIFPLVAGVMISVLDYSYTFAIISLLAAVSVIFVKKLKCR